MSDYNFDLAGVIGDWKIEIDSKAQYGYFENLQTGTSGGLWFEDGKLEDYDGIAVLPRLVKDLIIEQGYLVIE